MGRLLKGAGYIVPREVLSAREQAAKILNQAEADADLRRQEALVSAEEERQRGYQHGYDDGRQAALAELTELLAKARADAAEVRAGSREAAISLGRKMAEKIVGRALELHPSLIADIASQALAVARPRSGNVTLRVSPQDLSAIEQERPQLVARLNASVDLRMVADENVERGGCIVETPVARLDARLDRQLEALERSLGQRVAGPRGGAGT